MKKIYTFVLLLFISLMLVGCGGHRPSITLRVLDEQTKEPIEGAYGIAWWYEAHGMPGLIYHDLGELFEMVSDKEGNMKLPPFSTGAIPHIKVFKPGYVGWYNFKIYKGHYAGDIYSAKVFKRNDFQYISQNIYLERWKKKYSYDSHLSFLLDYIPTSPGYSLIFTDAIEEYSPYLTLPSLEFNITPVQQTSSARVYRLTWNGDRADSVTLTTTTTIIDKADGKSSEVSEVREVELQGCLEVMPTTNTTYTITAKGETGLTVKKITVKVAQ